MSFNYITDHRILLLNNALMRMSGVAHAICFAHITWKETAVL